MGNSFVKMIERDKIAVLFVSLVASFLTPFMVASVNIAIPKIGDELNIGAVYLGWIPSLYLLCSVIFLIPFGKLSDIYGRKRIFSYGITLITLSSVISAISFHWLMLLFSRALHGIGASMILGTGIAMLTSTFPLQKRGMVLGINVSFTYLGLMLGPVIGGFITHYLGWRSLFWGIVPIGIIVLFVVKVMVKENINNKSFAKNLDIKGTILYGLTIFFLSLGISSMAKKIGFLFIAFGLITFLFLIIRGKNTKESIFPVDLFVKNRVFAFSNLAAFVNYSATYGIGFILSFYLQKVRDLTPDKAGFIMIVQPVIMAILSPIAGKISDKLEPRIPASVGMGLITVGIYLLRRVDLATPYYIIVQYLILMGIGFSLFSSPNTNAVMSSVDKENYGVASSTIGTMRLLGQTFSMGIIVFLISIILGSKKVEMGCKEEILQIMHRATSIFTILSCCGIPLSFTRGNLRRESLNKIHPSAEVEP